jgi:hypothetical protein
MFTLSLLAVPTLALAEPPTAPAEVARVFFQSAIDRDWARLATVCPDVACVDQMKGERIVEILEIGSAYTTDDYAGVYVPYAIVVREGGRLVRREHHLAVRDDNPQRRYLFDGGY